jgi:hypothetical protein
MDCLHVYFWAMSGLSVGAVLDGASVLFGRGKGQASRVSYVRRH